MTPAADADAVRAAVLLTIVGNGVGVFEDRSEQPPAALHTAAGPDSAALLTVLTDWLPPRG